METESLTRLLFFDVSFLNMCIKTILNYTLLLGGLLVAFWLQKN